MAKQDALRECLSHLIALRKCLDLGDVCEVVSGYNDRPIMRG